MTGLEFTDTTSDSPFGQWPSHVEYQKAREAAKTGPDAMRAFYHLPSYIKRGCPVVYNGRRGVVTGWAGAHVSALLDGDARSYRYHPLDLGYPTTDPKAAS